MILQDRLDLTKDQRVSTGTRFIDRLTQMLGLPKKDSCYHQPNFFDVNSTVIPQDHLDLTKDQRVSTGTRFVVWLTQVLGLPMT